MVEISDQSRYGWMSIAFMTDKFGGTYIHLHYDLHNNKVVNWFGTKDAREINDIGFLSYFVKDEMNKELARRDLKKVYEMINAKY